MLLFIQLNFQQFVLFQMIYERWANKSRTVLTASTDHCVDFNKMEGVTRHKRLVCIMIVAFTFIVIIPCWHLWARMMPHQFLTLYSLWTALLELGILERRHWKTKSLTFLIFFFRRSRVFTGVLLGSRSRERRFLRQIDFDSSFDIRLPRFSIISLKIVCS